MGNRVHNKKGYVLIEMIVVLILVGIMATLAGMGLVAAVQGYIFSKDNAVFSAKAQLAVARINRELMECYTCKYPGTGSTTITSPFNYANPLGPRRITWGGGQTSIQLSDGTTTPDTLIDNVSSLSLSYDSSNSNRSILVTMVLNHPDGRTKTFTTNVYPRNSAY